MQPLFNCHNSNNKRYKIEMLKHVLYLLAASSLVQLFKETCGAPLADLQESFRHDDEGQAGAFKHGHHGKKNCKRKTTPAPTTTVASPNYDSTSLEEALLQQVVEDEGSELAASELGQNSNEQNARHQRCLIKDTTLSPPEMALGPFDDMVEIEAVGEEMIEDLLESRA